MPNTLCHIALQTTATRIMRPQTTFLLIVLGCIIPDLPWIAQRIVRPTGLFDPHTLPLYFSAQASLLFCLSASALPAVFSKRPLAVFLVVAGNCAAHLLLDASQEKWANGVHVAAPFTWKPLSYGMIWPEHIFWLFLSAVGLIIMAYFLFSRKNMRIEQPTFSTGRLWCAGGLFLLYVFAPFLVMDDIREADMYYMKTLQAKERTGKYLELDRAAFDTVSKTVKTYTGEQLTLTGNLPEESGLVSIRGTFSAPSEVKVSAYHIHSGFRNYASVTALFLACALAIQSVLLSRKKLSHRL